MRIGHRGQVLRFAPRRLECKKQDLTLELLELHKFVPGLAAVHRTPLSGRRLASLLCFFPLTPCAPSDDSVLFDVH